MLCRTVRRPVSGRSPGAPVAPARCGHANRDRHRVVPAGCERRRALRRADAEHLLARGHEPVVIAPAAARRPAAASTGCPTRWCGMPSRAAARLPAASGSACRPARLTGALRRAPAGRGAPGQPVRPRRRGAPRWPAGIGLPTVAVYQTDVPAYARAYRVGWGEAAAWRWIREIHNSRAAHPRPVDPTAADLVAQRRQRVWLWRRGVDAVRFDPAKRCDGAAATALAPGGELLVGYVGRLAPEKRVELLAATSALPGVRVVVVGDGPTRRQLARALPGRDLPRRAARRGAGPALRQPGRVRPHRTARDLRPDHPGGAGQRGAGGGAGQRRPGRPGRPRA